MIKNIYRLNQKNSLNRTIEYNLEENVRDNQILYGLEVKLISSKINEKVKIEDISNDVNFVMNIINYLYENAIDTVHCRDVIDDYILSLED